MDEIRRRTGRADEAIDEVITESGADLSTVGKAVREVNETLAVHAAWTEERFEAVDDRLVSLARVLVMTSSKIEMQIAGIDSRLTGFVAGQVKTSQSQSKLEENQDSLMQSHVAMLHKVERLEQGHETLQQQLAMLVETMQGLTARVADVLERAVSDEMRQHVSRLVGFDGRPAGEGFGVRGCTATEASG